MKYFAALKGKSLNLPYGLDIWFKRKKVLNIEWDDHDRVLLVSYKSGECLAESIHLIPISHLSSWRRYNPGVFGAPPVGCQFATFAASSIPVSFGLPRPESEYGANGFGAHERRCPQPMCQNGAPGLEIPR
jgi:hypothetical protein